MEHFAEWALGVDPRLVTLMQFISSALFALASFVIGVVALRIGYRNNFGWKPIALFASIGFHGGGRDPDHYGIEVRIDIWNRRKYPIRLELVRFKCPGLKLEEGVPHYDYVKGWHFTRNGAMWREAATLAPSSHQTYEIKAPFKRRSIDNLDIPLIAEVSFFDPKAKRYYLIKAHRNFNFFPDPASWWWLPSRVREWRRSWSEWRDTQPIRRTMKAWRLKKKSGFTDV